MLGGADALFPGGNERGAGTGGVGPKKAAACAAPALGWLP